MRINPKVDLNAVAIEAEGEEIQVGRFRGNILNPQVKPKGELPSNLLDTVHETDGHNIDAPNCDRGGETALENCMNSLYAEAGIEYAVDDVSGALLDPTLVHAGRKTEMDFFDGMKVYDRVPRTEQLKTGGKIIGTKWIDVNKGDIDNPKIRCRLAGK